MIRSLLRTLIAAAVLLLMVRTFLTLGVVAPVAVEGSSMAPALRGAWLSIDCPACDYHLDVGADQTPRSGEVLCPGCRAHRLDLTTATPHAGDRLWIVRHVTGLSAPRRWNLVAARRPDDAQRLCVKRVVGLPGETIQFVDGDLVVNGRPASKSLADQLRMRIPLDDVASSESRWQAIEGDCQQHADGWRLLASSAPATLAYQVPRGTLLTDGLPYNQRISRRLQPVRDLMLSANVSLEPDAQLAIVIDLGHDRVEAAIDARRNRVRLSVGSPVDSQEVSLPSSGVGVEITLSTFDGQALLAVDGHTILSLPHRPVRWHSPTSPEIFLRAAAARVTVHGPRLWRDVHYEHRVGDTPYDGPDGWRLGPDEWLLVGDNQAVSHDSRSWAPRPGVPSRLLVGRVVPRR